MGNKQSIECGYMTSEEVRGHLDGLTPVEQKSYLERVASTGNRHHSIREADRVKSGKGFLASKTRQAVHQVLGELEEGSAAIREDEFHRSKDMDTAGYHYKIAGNLSDAARVYESSGNFDSLGRLLEESGDSEGSRATFLKSAKMEFDRESVREPPHMRRLSMGLADKLKKYGDPVTARTIYVAIAKDKERFPIDWEYAAKAWAKAGDDKRSKMFYEKVLDTAEERGRWEKAGDLSRALGNEEVATDFYEKALWARFPVQEVAVTDPTGRSAGAYLGTRKLSDSERAEGIARLHQKMDNPEGAAGIYETFGVYEKAGKIRENLGDFDKALEDFRKAGDGPRVKRLLRKVK